jgi:hypothetical protein
MSSHHEGFKYREFFFIKINNKKMPVKTGMLIQAV